MHEFSIGKRQIGPEEPPFIIAEVGINHEGNYGKALEMIDAANEAGADCVKFQCHITEEEMIPTDMKPGKISDERLWDIIKRCELTADEERRLMSYCDRKGILFLSTPFSRAAADRLQSMGVAGYKIGSGECNNYPLLDHIAKFGKPVILSTGMNNIKSIRNAVDIFTKHGCPLALMHCTSMYPTPYDKVRLGAINELRHEFNLPVGLSDHSLGIFTCLGAVALGACLLEKHFTVSREWPGPDVPISIEPDELAEMVRGARAIWQARGGGKTILDEEKPVIDFAYSTVVSIAEIKSGERFSEINTWVKRPGTGLIKAQELSRVIGKRAARDIAANKHINPEDILEY